jgi:hypothetical protein
MIIMTLWISVAVAIMGFVVPAGASSKEFLDQFIHGQVTGPGSP